MSVIREKIEQKEKEYREKCESIHKTKLAQIKAVEREAHAKKMEVADKCVNDIIGKVL